MDYNNQFQDNNQVPNSQMPNGNPIPNYDPMPNGNPIPSNNYPHERQQDNALSLASLITGLCTLGGILCCGFTLPLSGISILLAALSRGDKKTLSSKAKGGLITSLIYLGVVCLFSLVIFFSLHMYDPSSEYWEGFRDGFNESLEEDGYDSFEDFLEQNGFNLNNEAEDI